MSFFWEAQDRDWPIYYPNSRRALIRHSLFRETGPFAQRYVTFRREVLWLRELLNATTWGVEVLLYNIALEEEIPARGARKVVPTTYGEPRQLAEEPGLADWEVPGATAEVEQLTLVIDELAAANDRISLSRAEQVASWRDVQGYLEAISLGLDTDLISLPMVHRPDYLYLRSEQRSRRRSSRHTPDRRLRVRGGG